MPEDKKEAQKPKSQVEVLGYPLSIFFIVVNEFCERFSYYGMRAVLVLYFRYFLRWDDDLATSIYHTFVALCYLTPILGAIVADSWLGKFKTIVYLSIVYTIGQVVMAVSAINDITDKNKDGTPDDITVHVILSMLGLFLIALGTGGIKPCVAAFGGDQFQDHQEKQRTTFFSIFYLSINAGSLLSTIITPILRAQECGVVKQKCYPLAFGVPAALMFVALIVFIVGSSMYYKAEPKGNIMLKVCKCIGFALKNRFRHRSSKFPKREHWMDWADEKYDKLLIAQVKMVLKVLFLYIPLPMFWTLFDQQFKTLKLLPVLEIVAIGIAGNLVFSFIAMLTIHNFSAKPDSVFWTLQGSRWTLQATTMNGDFGAMTIQPDQMQTVNPILILLLVPVMDSVVYPLLKKCHVNFTPLRKMTVGMFLAGIAFVAAALVQIEIDKTLPTFPSSSQGQVKFLNLRDTTVTVKLNNTEPFKIEAFKATADYLLFDKDAISVNINENPAKVFSLETGIRQTFLITPDITNSHLIDDLTTKPEQGSNAIRFVNGFNAAVNISAGETDFGIIQPLEVSNYTLFPKGKTTFNVAFSTGLTCTFSQNFGFGSSFTFLIPSTQPDCNTIIGIEDIQPNTVHMAWQIPQYLIMTTGEVVFSVTGLEFSYSQAPSNMKSVLQAGWLFTVAVGNIIVLIVAEAATIQEQWAEYILFACLLVVVCIIFSVMAYFYTYVDPSEIEAQFFTGEGNEMDEKDKKGKDELHTDRKNSVELKTEDKQTKI